MNPDKTPEGVEIPRDFFARDAEEQQSFITETWCDHCKELNLGMKNPREYELYGIVFIEGDCNKCGQPVLTEITEDDI